MSRFVLPTEPSGPESLQDATALLPSRRVFLMLQGPHGPFFNSLAVQLRHAGAVVWRVTFNMGDELFWSDPAHLIRHEGGPQDWPGHYARIVTRRGVTDIVLYGELRPIHAQAVRMAREWGLRVHILEEGYLRPRWITYERDGTNCASRLLQIGINEMRSVTAATQVQTAEAPPIAADVPQHRLYAAFYHFVQMIARRRYTGYVSHREISVGRESWLNLVRAAGWPLRQVQTLWRGRRIRRGGFPYMLVLMQLEHDSSFRVHSEYSNMGEFTDEVIDAFHRAAPGHHQLVFKAHPLEDDRTNVHGRIMDRARARGMSARIHYMPGGDLGALIDGARGVITVNSTGAQQALLRGIPVKAMGRSVYDLPGLASSQALDAFIARPQTPDPARYRLYRNYLLATSQIPGGYYSAPSRALALRRLTDLMLAAQDPYELAARNSAAHRQQVIANLA